MRKLFSLLAAVLFAGSMMATEASITFSEKGLTNGQKYASFNVDEVISLAFGDGANDGKYYTTGAAIRVYGGGHMTVSATEGATITAVAITFGDGDGTNAITTDVEAYADGAWAGSANSVTFTVGGTSGHRRIASVAVTYTAGEAPAVAKPAIAGEAFFYDSMEVAITCATEGASIYYTLDGTEPSAASTAYAAAIKLNATTTVKAIAIKGADLSAIAEKTFTKNPSFDSFEALVAAGLENNTLVEVAFADVLIDSIYVSSQSKRQGVYFAIADTAYEIYSNKAEVPEAWEAGGMISGTIRGNWTYYARFAIWELVPSAADWTWENLTYEAEEPQPDMAVIKFTEPVAKDSLAADASFVLFGSDFRVQITDPDNSMSIDANVCRFGDSEAYDKYTHRLKSGGKSSATKNFITVNMPKAGLLGIAVRTSSGSDTTRTLVAVQGNDTLYNEIVRESQAIKVMEDTTQVSVYPYIVLPAAAGSVVLSYPVGALNFYAFTYIEENVEPMDSIPTTAPAAPTAAEDDVLAIYCNHYTTNNLNFAISGWAGGYETLTIDSTKIGFWTNMTWECIIDPVNTDSAHDMSGYKKLHVDIWAPKSAKVKFTVEAIAGGNYKDGQVVDLVKGWNAFDFVVAEWPGNYDFKNVKCFVWEMYQTPAGESFEHNPFAFANIYFYEKESQALDNTSDGVKAVKYIHNGMLLIEKNGKVYTITGQVVR